jgi:hypothetical protein
MSVIRFVHTDSLRLGSPVSGLSDCPEWLRKVAGSAVRTAVTNVFEAAIAGRCHLLLIAGRLTESSQDLDLAITWLKGQAVALREHGIRLVIAGHPESDHPALRHLDAVLVAPGERLDVWLNGAERIECSVTPASTPGRTGVLGIEVGTQSIRRPQTELAYVAVPALSPSPTSDTLEGVAAAHNRLLRVSAGCPQSIGPTERGAFGCQLVEADLSRQTLTARACATDVIRFAQELISFRQGMAASQLGNHLKERSRILSTNDRRTTVVEWIIDGHLALSGATNEPLNEFELLKDLRGSLHAGHSGAWPYRIRFSDNSTVDASRHHSIAAKGFTAVVRERIMKSSRHDPLNENTSIGIPMGAGSEAAVGLDLLRRVAICQALKKGAGTNSVQHLSSHLAVGS